MTHREFDPPPAPSPAAGLPPGIHQAPLRTVDPLTAPGLVPTDDAPVAPRQFGAAESAPDPPPLAPAVPRFLYWLVSGVTVFFLVVTLVQLQFLQRRIDSPPTIDLSTALAPLDEGAVSTPDRLMFAQWRTLAMLEQNALERRYHQANVLLMSRTWTRYLGFMTGMLMALVGAAFVMGKLREESSALALRNAAIEASITTASPGLVLCLLGTVLMLVTIVTHNEIETRDANPLYTRVLLAPDGGAGGTAPPPMLPGAITDPLGGDEVADPLAEP